MIPAAVEFLELLIAPHIEVSGKDPGKAMGNIDTLIAPGIEVTGKAPA
ncbi:hypothetical protein EPK97_07165 [Chengkuizengella sediminis]|nr:hypothetical protein [Chengkuizengella sediminis]